MKNKLRVKFSTNDEEEYKKVRKYTSANPAIKVDGAGSSLEGGITRYLADIEVSRGARLSISSVLLDPDSGQCYMSTGVGILKAVDVSAVVNFEAQEIRAWSAHPASFEQVENTNDSSVNSKEFKKFYRKCAQSSAALLISERITEEDFLSKVKALYNATE